jgi:hypothetical protein
VELSPLSFVARLAAAAAITSCLLSCSPQQSSKPFADLNVPPTTLPSPLGSISGLAWMPNGMIVTSDFPGAGPTSRLVATDVHGATAQPLDLPVDPACRLTSQVRPAATAEGDLAFVQECYGQQANDFSAHLLSWNPVSDVVSDFGVVPEGVGTVASRAGRAYVSGGDAICDWILEVTPRGTRGLAVTVSGPTASFRLDDAAGLGDCATTGNAGSPSIDAAGRIAFLASPGSVGMSGQSRLDASWGIFVVDGAASSASLVLDQIQHARSLSWSPSGRKLAFAGLVIGPGEGIWLLDPASGDLRRVSALQANNLAWSPDGRSLAATLQTASGGSIIDIFDVSAVAN